jgi:hypothetical protein
MRSSSRGADRASTVGAGALSGRRRSLALQESTEKLAQFACNTLPHRRGGLQALKHDPEKWKPVSRLREARYRLVVSFDASAGEGRSEKIMLEQ